jgi:hypothetical protein
MNDLLPFAVAAHGGLDRWNALRSLQTELSITGAIWRIDGKPDVHSNGEEWRSLQVTFPESIATHTRTQISRFGPDGLLRRHDYTGALR